MSTCKNCRKPIEDDVNGFCPSENDACWYAWKEKQRPIEFMSKWKRLCELGTVNTKWWSMHQYEPKQWYLSMKYRGQEYGVSDISFEAAVTTLLAAVEPGG